MTLRSPDDISEQLGGFSEFSRSRASVTYPPKMDVPFVWDMYMDTETPLGAQSAGGAGYDPTFGWAGADSRVANATGMDSGAATGLGVSFGTGSRAAGAAPDVYAGVGAAAGTGVGAGVSGSGTGGGAYDGAAARDIELLALMNDRLKQQSRRYPHPITNDMEDFQ